MEQPSARPAGTTGPDRGRDPWWDNARFVSATLIVILHTMGSIMAQHHALHALHVSTWALRVPAFVILAGVFSSAGPLGPRQLRAVLQSIVVPALLFSVLFSLEAYWLGAEFTLHIAQLPWTLWFLMALFFWRLLLPLVVQLRHPLLVTTVVALAVGYIDEFGMLFAASRTLVYMPLFYLGWRIGQGSLRTWFTSRWSLPLAAAGLVAAGVVGWLWHRDISGAWLSMSDTYRPEDPMSLRWAWLIRLAVLASAAFLVLCFLRLVPRRRLPLLSALGAGGFTIYLLHPLFIMPVREHGLIAKVNTPLEQIGLVLCALTLSMVLGSTLVRRVFQPLIRPPVTGLFARTPVVQRPVTAPWAAPLTPQEQPSAPEPAVAAR
ncbi:acyltransferase family protein [Actinacidiphila glaucinigra]|uniref:Fucose 4-O-acetylase n=1 Tax=Actinacidiphila glaucinigra TaxID=235986 RepID=A0A239AR61_9ACTN|nr:acyltransferase family protein [Actinacidiphila glaucinigra]SNR97802.1 Fucose 4-O-acetylase [Actinacidiphila glaucinigra]